MINALLRAIIITTSLINLAIHRVHPGRCVRERGRERRGEGGEGVEESYDNWPRPPGQPPDPEQIHKDKDRRNQRAGHSLLARLKELAFLHTMTEGKQLLDNSHKEHSVGLIRGEKFRS